MRSFHKTPPEITARAKNMRQSPTPAERCLWSILRGRHINDCKFVRQYPIPPYIVDFCCREKKLVIEADGGVHIGQQADDHARDQNLIELGYRVLSFSNDEVLNNINAVVTIIQEALNS